MGANTDAIHISRCWNHKVKFNQKADRNTMRVMVRLILGVVIAPLFAHAQGAVGDWQGDLKAGGAELRLLLHISRSKNGMLNATLDSISQGRAGIPVDSVVLHDNVLTLKLDSIHGSYRGVLSRDANSMEGTWTQGMDFPLAFKRIRASSPSNTSTDESKVLEGTWSGNLQVGKRSLVLVFRIFATPAGLAGTLDSPDQHVSGLPITRVIHSGSSLEIEVDSIHAQFEAQFLGGDETAMTGQWHQNGSALPLIMRKSISSSRPAPK